MHWLADRAAQKSSGNYGGGHGGGRRRGGGGDNGDYCSGRFDEEAGRCYERYNERKYAIDRLLKGCEGRASNRRNMCTANGGVPHPDESDEWGMKDEEGFRNLWR